jgi:hypothetical protein
MDTIDFGHGFEVCPKRLFGVGEFALLRQRLESRREKKPVR